MAELKKPRIHGTTHSWGETNPESSYLVTEIELENPNSAEIQVADLKTDVEIDGIPVGATSSRCQSVGPGETVTLSNLCKIDNSLINQWWPRHVREDESSLIKIEDELNFGLDYSDFSYLSEVTRSFDTELATRLSEKPNESLRYGPVDLKLREVETGWSYPTTDAAELVTSAKIRNLSAYPVRITSYDYLLEMNDVPVAHGESEADETLPPLRTGTAVLDTALDYAALADWWHTHLHRDETTELRFRLEAILQVGGDNFRIKLLDRDHSFQTDILAETEEEDEEERIPPSWEE